MDHDCLRRWMPSPGRLNDKKNSPTRPAMGPGGQGFFAEGNVGYFNEGVIGAASDTWAWIVISSWTSVSLS